MGFVLPHKPGLIAKVSGILALVGKVGPESALHIVGTRSKQIRRPILRLATETFWSRSPYRWGDVFGRFRIRALLLPAPLAST